MFAKSVETSNVDLELLDQNLMRAEKEISSNLKTLIARVDLISAKLHEVRTIFEENTDSIYAPADYNHWYGNPPLSLKEIRDARNTWLHKMYRKAWGLEASRQIEKDLEAARKEFVPFKNSIVKYLFTMAQLRERERDLLCGWRTIFFIREGD